MYAALVQILVFLLLAPAASAQTWTDGTPVEKGLANFDQTFSYAVDSTAEPTENQDVTACDKPLVTLTDTTASVALYDCDNATDPRSKCTLLTATPQDGLPAPVQFARGFARPRVTDIGAGTGSLQVKCEDVFVKTFVADSWTVTYGSGGGGGASVNTLQDTNGDGTEDYILCGDYDGDGKLETIDDVQGCVLALTAAAGESNFKHIKVVPGHFYASIDGSEGNADACDAACLLILEPVSNGMRGMIQLESNTHLEGSGQDVTTIQGFQMAGSPGSVTGFPPAGVGDNHSIIANEGMDDSTGNVNIEISGMTVDGGFTWYNSSSDTSIGIVRGIDLHNVTNGSVHDTIGVETSHASIFLSDSVGVEIYDNVSRRAGGFRDQSGNVAQAGIYIFACGAADCNSRTPTGLVDRLMVKNNTIYENAGTGINMRNDSWDDGSVITKVFMHGNRVDTAGLCVKMRGVEKSQAYDTSCSRTTGSIAVVVNQSNLIFEDAFGVDNIIIDGLTVTNVDPGNNLAGLNISAYTQGVTYRNITIVGSTENGMNITAPIRDVKFENIQLIDNGEKGLLLNGDFGDFVNQRLVMRGLAIRNMNMKNLGQDAVFNPGIQFANLNTHKGTEITGLTIEGVGQYGVIWDDGSTMTDSNVSDWRVDATTPRYIGDLLDVADIAPASDLQCRPRLRGSMVTVTDAASATDCSAGGVTTNNGCTCQSVKVAGVSQASLGVVDTASTHYLDVDNEVCFENVGGMTELNGNCYAVNTVPSATSLTLKAIIGGAAVDTSGFTAFSCTSTWFQGTEICEAGDVSGWMDNGTAAWATGAPIRIESRVGWNRVRADNWVLSNARNLDGVLFANSPGLTSAYNDNSWNSFQYFEDNLATDAAPWGIDFADVVSGAMLSVSVRDPLCIGTSTGCINPGTGMTTAGLPASVASSAGGALAINSATLATAGAVYDLPDECDAATGAWAMLYSSVAAVVSLGVTDASDTIVYKGLSLSAGEELDSPGAAQDSVTVVCTATNTWSVTANSGDWVEETP